jgi:lipopolysaccharide export system ATP-binding protein
MRDPVLRADGICKTFASRAVLKSAALWARAGAVTLLLGRNGSGKTTLMRIAAGLLRADQGRVQLADRSWETPALHRLATHGLFYLPERGLLLRNRRVLSQLQMLARRFDVESELPAAIRQFRLDSLTDRLPDMLSGGEVRRVELALAWLRNPLCLLADEPFMGIAPADAEEISHALRALARRGAAVVVSGHEVPLLLDLADEVVWVVAGTTHGLGSPAQAREHWQFRREYLGMNV